MPREDGTLYIEDLRGLHNGKEIWIIGSGPSLDDFPDDFFDDRVSIALNGVYRAFPNCTYIHSCDIRFARRIRNKHPELLAKCIFTERPNFHWEGHQELIQMNFSGKQASEQDMKRIVKCITTGVACCYMTMQTIAHTAIQAAAVLGAKRITLAGCEARARNGRIYAIRRGMDKRERDSVLIPSYFPGYKDGTKWLTKALRPAGVEVVRYYYHDIPEYEVKAGYERGDRQ